MSSHNKLNPEQQLADWLEGKGEEHPEMSSSSEEDKQWQQRLATAQALHHQESLTPEQSVPSWDRGAAFESDRAPWWQWGGLPATSMAFSFLAMALVLFKVEFVMQDSGVLLSFAGSNQNSYSQEDINALVDAKVNQQLKSFASEQQVVLANYVADIKVKQQDSNLQLASYIMGAARQERKEDISDFIQYINAERKDESLDNKIKFQEIERAIKYQQTNYQPSGFQSTDFKNKKLKNNNYQQQNSDSLGLVTKPANLTSEE
jgi:hypothetical protein